MSAEAPEAMGMDVRVDVLEERLRRNVEVTAGFADEETMAYRLKLHFYKYDTDRSGSISFDEFEAAMIGLNFVGCQREIRGLFHRYDRDGSGRLEYQEFAQLVCGARPNPKGSAESRSALVRLKEKIRERGGLNGIRSLSRVFRVLDDNGNKLLNMEEFEYGLRDFGLALPRKDLTTLFRVFDKSGDGNISFDELLVGLRGDMNHRRLAIVAEAFRRLDKTGDGVVTVEDIRASYDASRHPDVAAGRKDPDEVFAEFMSQWDSKEEADGVVTLDEFTDYYRDISASMDSDDAFELMIRNAWRISGGKGAAENTANLRVLVEYSDGTQSVEEVKDCLGLSPSDTRGIIERLEAQGIEDIVHVSVR